MPVFPARTLSSKWFRRTGLIERGLSIVAGVAVGGGIAVQLLQGFPPVFAIPPLVAAIGLAVGHKRPQVGLVLVACAPLSAVLISVSPLLTWTIAVFAVLVLTLRGLSGRFAGIFVATANYIAVSWSAGTFFDPEAFVAGSLALAAAGIGSATIGHARYLQAMEQLAADAVANHDREVSQQIVEERMRIARDLHDGVGHEVAVVSLQIGMAEVALPTEARAARAALVSARHGVQSILAEMQLILDVLRTADDVLAPPPGLDRVPGLVGSFRVAGLDLTADLDPIPERVSTSVSIAVHRLIQALRSPTDTAVWRRHALRSGAAVRRFTVSGRRRAARRWRSGA